VSISFRDHKVQKIAGGILIFAIIGVLWFTQIYTPNKLIIKEKRETLEQLNLKLSNIKLSAAKLPQLRKEVERLFIRYKLLEELMPTSRDVPDFVNKLNISARENNMKIRRVDVIPTEQSEYFHTNPYKVMVTGNYHELGAFLEAIANLKFVATVKNFMIKKNTNPSESISAEFVITTYHIPSTERLQPPTLLEGQDQSAQSGGITKPTDTAKPRATENEAIKALSGANVPDLTQ